MALLDVRRDAVPLRSADTWLLTGGGVRFGWGVPFDPPRGWSRKRDPGFMRWWQHSLILEGC
jgi:hypothetical protein